MLGEVIESLTQSEMKYVMILKKLGYSDIDILNEILNYKNKLSDKDIEFENLEELKDELKKRNLDWLKNEIDDAIVILQSTKDRDELERLKNYAESVLSYLESSDIQNTYIEMKAKQIISQVEEMLDEVENINKVYDEFEDELNQIVGQYRERSISKDEALSMIREYEDKIDISQYEEEIEKIEEEHLDTIRETVSQVEDSFLENDIEYDEALNILEEMKENTLSDEELGSIENAEENIRAMQEQKIEENTGGILSKVGNFFKSFVKKFFKF